MLNSPALSLIGIGFSLAFWIAGGAILGHWLDGKFGTDPLLTVVLLVLGMVIGFYDAYRRLHELVKFNGRKTGR